MMRAKRTTLKERCAEEIPMLQPALQVTPPRLAPEILIARKPLSARALFRALVDHTLLILRRLGEFFAAGGTMS